MPTFPMVDRTFFHHAICWSSLVCRPWHISLSSWPWELSLSPAKQHIAVMNSCGYSRKYKGHRYLSIKWFSPEMTSSGCLRWQIANKWRSCIDVEFSHAQSIETACLFVWKCCTFTNDYKSTQITTAVYVHAHVHGCSSLPACARRVLWLMAVS